MATLNQWFIAGKTAVKKSSLKPEIEFSAVEFEMGKFLTGEFFAAEFSAGSFHRVNYSDTVVCINADGLLVVES